MSRKHRFRPSNIDHLEPRIVLSSAHVSQLSKRSPKQTRLQTATESINRSFDVFTSDYLQSQSTYLASNNQSSGGTNVAFTSDQFRVLTAGRIDLLAQELTRAMSGIPGSLVRAKGASQVPLQSFLRQRITGTQAGSTSLKAVLTSQNPSLVPPANSNDATVTLFTIQAQNAIEAARTATINSATFIKNGTFTKKSH